MESTRLGRYQLLERLGMGAMGAVYRARDDSLGRDVAIKTIHTIGRSPFQIEMFQARFGNEARALAALSHPNIVNVFDVSLEGETPYLVMELVQGRSLADRLEQEGPLSPDEAHLLGQQLALALEAAHERAIIHRDVKPANILEASPGCWKLADFGVAHLPDSSLTLTGQFLGSPAYAAPEALEHGAFAPPTDVYGVGATLYEALSGSPPFGSGGLLTVGALAADSKPRPLAESCPEVPTHMAGAIMGALERDPNRRLTARQLADALNGHGPVTNAATPASVPYPTYIPPGSRRRVAAIATAVALLLLGIALGAGLAGDGDSPRAAPAPAGGPPARALQAHPAADRYDRSLDEKTARKNRHHWRKVEDKLREGKAREAREHLREILRRDPDDARARSLYQQLERYEHYERDDRDDDRDDWD